MRTLCINTYVRENKYIHIQNRYPSVIKYYQVGKCYSELPCPARKTFMALNEADSGYKKSTEVIRGKQRKFYIQLFKFLQIFLFSYTLFKQSNLWKLPLKATKHLEIATTTIHTTSLLISAVTNYTHQQTTSELSNTSMKYEQDLQVLIKQNQKRGNEMRHNSIKNRPVHRKPKSLVLVMGSRATRAQFRYC